MSMLPDARTAGRGTVAARRGQDNVPTGLLTSSNPLMEAALLRERDVLDHGVAQDDVETGVVEREWLVRVELDGREAVLIAGEEPGGLDICDGDEQVRPASEDAGGERPIGPAEVEEGGTPAGLHEAEEQVGACLMGAVANLPGETSEHEASRR
jgi:hypothetical protein